MYVYMGNVCMCFHVFNIHAYIYIYVCVRVRACVCVCEEIRLIWQNVRRKGKTEERYMFDGLFICQRVSTSIFFSFLNAKIFFQNYLRMRKNYHR